MENKKLEKIINMARRGTENEKENAIRIIRNICQSKGLVFEEVMQFELDLEEFKFEYRGLLKRDIAHQIYFKIIGGEYLSSNKYYIFFKCTKAKFIKFQNAFDVYRKLYNRERKKFLKRQAEERKVFADAFIQRHDIYGKLTVEQMEKIRRERKIKGITEDDIKKARMSDEMASEMEEDAIIHKLMD